MSRKINAIIASEVIAMQPQGAIDAVRAIEFQHQLLSKTVAASLPFILLVDFSEVTVLNSEGLMALISTLNLARRLGRRLCFCSVSPTIRMIFELSQLDRVFEIYESRTAFEEAIASNYFTHHEQNLKRSPAFKEC